MPISVNSLPNVQSLAYAAARSAIRSGDILLCSGTSLISQMIQNATKSIWSHVAFIIRLEAIDRVMVLESVESIGVRTVPLSSYIRNYNGTGKGYPGHLLVARHEQFNPTDITHLSKFAVNLLGYPYNTQDILKIAARINATALGFTQQSPAIQATNAYICSEYAYECFKSVGITINYDPAGFIAPSDFAKEPLINAMALLPTENFN